MKKKYLVKCTLEQAKASLKRWNLEYENILKYFNSSNDKSQTINDSFKKMW